MVAKGIAATSSYATTFDALVAAEAALWSAVSLDATRVEEGAAASDIASSPLWPQRHRICSNACASGNEKCAHSRWAVARI